MHQTDSINANTKYAGAALKGATIGAMSGFLLGVILWIPACVVGTIYIRTAKPVNGLNFDEEVVAGKAFAGTTFEFTILICVLIGVGVQLSIVQGKLREAHRLELQRQQEEERKRREAEGRAMREREALELAQKSRQNSLLDLRFRSHELFFTLPEFARGAAKHLDTAQREFEANAFAPFWDEIETVVNNLGEFAECIEKISQNADRYNQEAPNCPLPVPDFGVSLAVLPDIQPIVEKFALVVRKAQTDFQFSVIYEQRKTNKILVAGFASLHMAIASMGTRIDTSLRKIHRALS